MNGQTAFILAFLFLNSPAVHALPATMNEAKLEAAKLPATAYEKKCRALIAAKGKKPESARLKEIFDFQWNYLMTNHPEWATYVGIKGQDDRWTDSSLSAIALRKRESLCELKMAKSVQWNKLNGNDQLSLDLFKYRAETSQEGQKFPGEYLVINQMGGAHLEMARIFEVMPKTTAKDFENHLSRLRKVPQAVDEVLVLLKEGLRLKVTPPKITLRDVPNQVAAMIKENPLESPILLAFKEMPTGIPTERADALRAEAQKIYSENIKPKLEEFHRFLVDTYVPGARETIAWKDLPGGSDWYALRVKLSTTTDLTPQQIHKIGLDEVARIQGEMEKVVKEAKFSGDLEKFKKEVNTNKKFFFKTGDELIAGYQQISKKIDPELVKLFGRLPRLPYGIKPMPEHSQVSSAAAYYEGGSLEAGRAGYFVANTYKMEGRPTWEMESLTLHEAVPGHHFQIALAQEMESGPEFRKHDHFTAYTEGWGLYAETLGYELGVYKDPYSKFGQLTNEMWRAIRLVVDTGMHDLGWSRQQAIDYMKKNLGRSEREVIVEIDRYIVWAGQATAYKIGQLKFKELREKSMKILGDRFDVRKFHDVVLGKGALPLNVLESVVDDYLAKEQAKAKTKI